MKEHIEMAYGDLYQRRKPAPLDLTASLPEPVEQSHVERMRRLHPVSLDATTGAGWSERELAEAREWRRLYTGGLLGFGVTIPNKYLSFACEGAAPQNAPFALEAASDPKASIARQINAGRSMHARLATDNPRSRRDLATDHAEVSRRADWSHHLQLIIGQHESMDEDVFRSEMERLGITSTSEKMGLITEATHFRLLRARGAPPKLPARYIPAPHLNDPKNQHFIDNNSPVTTKDTGGRPDTPGKKHVTTIQASDSQGYCAYDRTSITLL